MRLQIILCKLLSLKLSDIAYKWWRHNTNCTLLVPKTFLYLFGAFLPRVNSISLHKGTALVCCLSALLALCSRRNLFFWRGFFSLVASEHAFFLSVRCIAVSCSCHFAVLSYQMPTGTSLGVSKGSDYPVESRNVLQAAFLSFNK